VLTGALVAESLQMGTVFEVPNLTLTRISRRDVSESAAEAQPPVWTLVEFEAADEVADQLADAFARSLLAEGGWYASFTVGNEHVVIFAGRIFRQQRGDRLRRAEIESYARHVGVPPEQMDWGD
jgi:hypothetical protein